MYDATLCWCGGECVPGETICVSCCVVVQVAFSANSSVALRLTREEEELDHLTSDLSALLRQVEMIHSVKS